MPEYGEGECSCRFMGRGGNDPDAYWRIDKWCPIHGIDVDRALEERRERERDRAIEEPWSC